MLLLQQLQHCKFNIHISDVTVATTATLQIQHPYFRCYCCNNCNIANSTSIFQMLLLQQLQHCKFNIHISDVTVATTQHPYFRCFIIQHPYFRCDYHADFKFCRYMSTRTHYTLILFYIYNHTGKINNVLWEKGFNIGLRVDN